MGVESRTHAAASPTTPLSRHKRVQCSNTTRMRGSPTTGSSVFRYASNSRSVFSCGGLTSHGRRSAARHWASLPARRTAPARVRPGSEYRRSNNDINHGAGHASRPRAFVPFQPENSQPGKRTSARSRSSHSSDPSSISPPRSSMMSSKARSWNVRTGIGDLGRARHPPCDGVRWSRPGVVAVVRVATT